MERRRFIHLAGLASAATLFPDSTANPLSGAEAVARSFGVATLRAKDVNAHLRSLAPVAEPSVDRIVIGDPETEVSHIGTCWLPDWDTCRRAVGDGNGGRVAQTGAVWAPEPGPLLGRKARQEGHGEDRGGERNRSQGKVR